MLKNNSRKLLIITSLHLILIINCYNIFIYKLEEFNNVYLFQPLSNSQYAYGAYSQQLSYWYPQGYPTTAAAQMQGQYLPGMQGGYSYGQYGYQQSYLG